MTRILLVDDSVEVRRSVRAVLAGAVGDASFGEAGDAAAALALLAGERWDVVVLDLSLPDRNGFDTLREMRRRQPALPIVVMSFHDQPEYARAARGAGAAGYVAKGSESAAIAAAVTGALAAPPPSGT
ncbi:MAG TPA: response regulator transcription factor [Polyangia bacterium]